MGELSALLLVIFLRYEQLIDIDVLQQYIQEQNTYTVVAEPACPRCPPYATMLSGKVCVETLGLPAPQRAA